MAAAKTADTDKGVAHELSKVLADSFTIYQKTHGYHWNVRGPNFWQVDLAATKSLPLGDRVRMQFRIETFNLFNRVNFTAPAANRSNSTFGTITSTYDARQVQLGLKLIW